MPNFHIRAYTVHITNLTKQEIRLSEEVRISHQGLTVQVTIALQLHQAKERKVLYIPALPAGSFSFLIFCTFLSGKKYRKNNLYLLLKSF